MSVSALLLTFAVIYDANDRHTASMYFMVLSPVVWVMELFI